MPCRMSGILTGSMGLLARVACAGSTLHLQYPRQAASEQRNSTNQRGTHQT